MLVLRYSRSLGSLPSLTNAYQLIGTGAGTEQTCGCQNGYIEMYLICERLFNVQPTFYPYI